MRLWPTVDAQSDHHRHARKLSIAGAIASQFDPRWIHRTCPTPLRGDLSDEKRLVSSSGTHVLVAHSKLCSPLGLRSGLLGGHKSGVMKFGVSFFSSATVS